MSTAWAGEEMAHADFKDRRLNRRAVEVLAALGERPTASIPAACGGHAESVAAYRFFDNDKVTWQRVLEPHYERTRQRAAQHRRVLLVQDTTEVDLTRPQQQVQGAGPLSCGTRRGVFLHPLQLFTPDGTPLGAAWVDLWARPPQPQPAPATDRKKKRGEDIPIEEKESYRWLQGLRQARNVAQELPQTTCVCIADSEADIYELFAEPRGERPVEWLIRAAYLDRRVQAAPTVSESATDSDATVRQLREQLLRAPVLYTQEIDVRGRHAKVSCDQRARRQPRQDRTTLTEVRAAAVMLQPPRRADRTLPVVTVQAVFVRELAPPADEEPVEWLLLTTLPIDSDEQVREIVQHYTVRFQIEVYFRVLKSGCRVEKRLFERTERLLPCVAVYLVVAWRTLLLCRLGRSEPELNCEEVLTPSEWQSVWQVVQRTELPEEPPRLLTMLRLIAQLGGYVNRAGRLDPPGPQTLWLGMQRMHDLALAWETFGPGAAKPPPVNDV